MFRAQIESFVVRPALDGSDLPLIEFLGDHRAPGYPQVVSLLGQTLVGFACRAEPSMPDDFVWRCRCSAGEFEISDDWAALFILARENHEQMIEAIAHALEKTSAFRRLDTSLASPRSR